MKKFAVLAIFILLYSAADSLGAEITPSDAFAAADLAEAPRR